MLNFETTAMRCRSAGLLRGGPEGATGFLVGKTVQEAAYEHTWESCVLIGITNEEVLLRDDDSMMGDNGEIIGLCAQPNYVIKESDLIIFIGATSNPAVSPEGIMAAPDELESAGVDLTPFDRQQLVLDMLKPMKILIIGWRWVWTTSPSRLKNRIYEIARSAAKGSYIVFMNQMATDERNAENDAPGFAETITATGVVEPIRPGDSGDGGEEILPGCTGGWRLKEYPSVRVFHAGR